MSDLDQVLRLWRAIEAGDEDCVLATIVRVEGSSYRKPGARMLVTKGGLRAGTISGGCLEAEVSKQAWWLTEAGPVVRPYSTTFEIDSERPYGLGCGGIVHLLLERREQAAPFLRELQCAFSARQAMTRKSFLPDGTLWSEAIPPRCGLFVFGAGDDAKPLVIQAATLGWHITVADGRAHLATRARFPEAEDVRVLRDGSVSTLSLLESDAAVVMTHSYQQDTHILQSLLPMRLTYLGVLGPRYRTADLMKDAATALGGSACDWMKKVHAPVGLDLGGDSPATIALAILAEIQGAISQSQRLKRAPACPS